METPIKMDDLEVPLFLETPIYPIGKNDALGTFRSGNFAASHILKANYVYLWHVYKYIMIWSATCVCVCAFTAIEMTCNL